MMAPGTIKSYIKPEECVARLISKLVYFHILD